MPSNTQVLVPPHLCFFTTKGGERYLFSHLKSLLPSPFSLTIKIHHFISWWDNESGGCKGGDDDDKVENRNHTVDSISISINMTRSEELPQHKVWLIFERRHNPRRGAEERWRKRELIAFERKAWFLARSFSLFAIFRNKLPKGQVATYKEDQKECAGGYISADVEVVIAKVPKIINNSENSERVPHEMVPKFILVRKIFQYKWYEFNALFCPYCLVAPKPATFWPLCFVPWLHTVLRTSCTRRKLGSQLKRCEEAVVIPKKLPSHVQTVNDLLENGHNSDRATKPYALGWWCMSQNHVHAYPIISLEGHMGTSRAYELGQTLKYITVLIQNYRLGVV
ncbi:hypothetical protein VNO77_14393 [Canavalia gladiata]|uniref:Uncharacterized protein n=1 Tax=Canavalia gladiata TaxID=3824 RepID=A0AAN9QRZ7_CANGL